MNPGKKMFIASITIGCLLLVQNTKAQSATLIEAVSNNDIKEVNRFLLNGADVNAYDDDSDNVLINAAIYASVGCM